MLFNTTSLDYLDNYFKDAFKSFDRMFADDELSFNEPFPPTNVFFGNDKSCEIALALAGYSKDELNIYVEDEKIIIEANPKKTEKKGGQFYREKIKKNAFKRAYSVDSSHKYDFDNIKVTFENGLLTITVPKKKDEEAKKRVIEIQ